ncbi:MAG: hypothetical protein QOH05_3097 [Acetobacteraceae bacterium]|jgi:hypothetical protein|nr:hypothetical protein [Acetobacteraceae bacterium]
MPAVPFKANAKCRHHIPKQKRRLTNWPAYEASLRRRGDLTVWFSEEAIAARYCLTPAGLSPAGPRQLRLAHVSRGAPVWRSVPAVPAEFYQHSRVAADPSLS